MRYATIRLLMALGILAGLGGCSIIVDHTDEATLRQRYDTATSGQSSSELAHAIILKTVAIGVVSYIIPGLHLLGLFVDAAVIADNVDRTIYGQGAIAAREHHCPALIGNGDFSSALGVWYRGIRSSAELEAALGLAALIAPRAATSEEAAMAFVTAVKAHGIPVIGKTVSSLLVGKLGIKALTGIMPVVGPLISGGINWYIFDGLNDAAMSYYQQKANQVCRPGGAKN